MRLAVLVSGRGTILRAMFDAGLPVAVVVADRPCEALAVCREYGAVGELVDGVADDGTDDGGVSGAVAAALLRHRVDLVALAGFESTLGGAVHRAFPGRILNVHPSLPPALSGDAALTEALIAGAGETGCSVYLERPEPGPGPTIAREPVKVVYRDTEATLRARIEVVERSLYPATVRWALEQLEAGGQIVAPPEWARSADPADERPEVPAARTDPGFDAVARAWRSGTASLRPMPDVMIIGAQRGGTTSLRTWLGAHPSAHVFQVGEVHYFDNYYDRGPRWYRSRFPTRLRRVRRVESSPYMLFHPLAPTRAAHDLPAATRFVALLREPAERAYSQYRRERSKGRERMTFAQALAAEDDRLAGEVEKVRRGEPSIPHQFCSYRSRGLYAEQLEQWFDAVGAARVKVVESEALYRDPAVAADLLAWLGLPPARHPFPALNASPAPAGEDKEALRELRSWYQPHNEELFSLIGETLWEDGSSFP